MINAGSTLRAIALERPATIRVFERLQLDYCCGGNRPLSEACAQKAIDVAVFWPNLQRPRTLRRPRHMISRMRRRQI